MAGFEFGLHNAYEVNESIGFLTTFIVSDATVKRFGRKFTEKHDREFYGSFLPAYLDYTGREKIRYLKLGFENLSVNEQEDSVKDFIRSYSRCFAEFIVDAV